MRGGRRRRQKGGAAWMGRISTDSGRVNVACERHSMEPAKENHGRSMETTKDTCPQERLDDWWADPSSPVATVRSVVMQDYLRNSTVAVRSPHAILACLIFLGDCPPPTTASRYCSVLRALRRDARYWAAREAEGMKISLSPRAPSGKGKCLSSSCRLCALMRVRWLTCLCSLWKELQPKLPCVVPSLTRRILPGSLPYSASCGYSHKLNSMLLNEALGSLFSVVWPGGDVVIDDGSENGSASLRVMRMEALSTFILLNAGVAAVDELLWETSLGSKQDSWVIIGLGGAQPAEGSDEDGMEASLRHFRMSMLLHHCVRTLNWIRALRIADKLPDNLFFAVCPRINFFRREWIRCTHTACATKGGTSQLVEEAARLLFLDNSRCRQFLSQIRLPLEGDSLIYRTGAAPSLAGVTAGLDFRTFRPTKDRIC